MKMTHRGFLRGFRSALFFLCIGFLFALAPAAHAHARMVKSVPVKDAELAAQPAQIELWFNELLEEGFNTISVFPKAELAEMKVEKRSNLTDGKVILDPKDHTHITIKLAALAPGDYVVEWRVLSRDGHSAPGRILFSVKGGK